MADSSSLDALVDRMPRCLPSASLSIRLVDLPPARLSSKHSAGPACALLHVLTRSGSLRSTVAASGAPPLPPSSSAGHASRRLRGANFFQKANGQHERSNHASPTWPSHPYPRGPPKSRWGNQGRRRRRTQCITGDVGNPLAGGQQAGAVVGFSCVGRLLFVSGNSRFGALQRRSLSAGGRQQPV